MIRHLHTFEITCDYCGKRETFQTTNPPGGASLRALPEGAPDGWRRGMKPLDFEYSEFCSNDCATGAGAR